MSSRRKTVFCAVLLAAVASPAFLSLKASEPVPAERRAMGSSGGGGSRVDPLYAMRGRPEGEQRPVSRTVTREVPRSSAPASVSPPASPSSLPPELRNSPRYQARPVTTPYRSLPKHPWKTKITTTIFWIGEKPSGRNKTPNLKSSWDGEWMQNYGGYDDPNPANRTSNYHPKGFIPRQNPFYVALPYNDVAKWNQTKREAAHVIPWFRQKFTRHGRTVCKGRWIAVRYGNKTCYAQWEDCGPFTTDDWNYVFGKARPSNPHNNSAGLDVSPAVRDYLGMKSGAKCDWRFCELDEVPVGPWRQFGDNNPFVGLVEKQQKDEIERMKAAREAWLRRQHVP